MAKKVGSKKSNIFLKAWEASKETDSEGKVVVNYKTFQEKCYELVKDYHHTTEDYDRAKITEAFGQFVGMDDAEVDAASKTVAAREFFIVVVGVDKDTAIDKASLNSKAKNFYDTQVDKNSFVAASVKPAISTALSNFVSSFEEGSISAELVILRGELSAANKKIAELIAKAAEDSGKIATLTATLDATAVPPTEESWFKKTGVKFVAGFAILALITPTVVFGVKNAQLKKAFSDLRESYSYVSTERDNEAAKNEKLEKENKELSEKVDKHQQSIQSIFDDVSDLLTDEQKAACYDEDGKFNPDKFLEVSDELSPVIKDLINAKTEINDIQSGFDGVLDALGMDQDVADFVDEETGIVDMDVMMDAMQDHIAEQSERIQRMIEEATLNGEISREEAEAYLAELEAAQDQLDELESKIAALKSAYEKKDAELDSLQTLYDELRAELEEKKGIIADYENAAGSVVYQPTSSENKGGAGNVADSVEEEEDGVGVKPGVQKPGDEIVGEKG